MKVEVVKHDPKSIRSFSYSLHVPTDDVKEALKVLRKAVNVGDFVVLPNREVYRRIKGGFKKAAIEDLADLIASRI